jgi:hemerythrin
MAVPLIWSDSWLLGIDILDEAHREMVRLINRLVEAESTAETMSCLEELIALLRAHFRVEEEFLAAIGYPSREAHRREHRIQLAEFVDLHRRLVAREGSRLDAAHLSEIRDWFFNHVVAEDKNFAAFYHNAVCADGVGYRRRGQL